MTVILSGLLKTIIESFVQGFAAQYAVIIPIYLVCWVWFEVKFKRFRIQTTKRAGMDQIRREFINGLYILVMGVFTTPVIFWLTKEGYTKIYTDSSLYGGLPYILITAFLLIVISDTWFYWSHRYFHSKKVYQYVHAVHHQSLDTTPFTALSFHVFEGFWLGAFIYIVMFVFPISIAAIGIVQIVGLLNNIKSHLGYEFYPKWFDKTPLKYLVNSTHHNLHHTRYNGNYSLFFTFWDLVCGTELDNQESFTAEVKNHKKSIVISNNTTYKQLSISKIVHELDDVVSIYFTPEDKKFYDYLPGQYLSLSIKVDGFTYERLFSLSSSPITDKFLRITVKKHKVVTDYLINKAKVGDTINALYPTGDFNINPGKADKKEYLMIAGGSGITPIYSMIKSIIAVEKKSKITLMYANSSKSSIIFDKELKELVKHNPNFTITNCISGVKRIDKKAIETHLNDSNSNNVFICGPEGLKISVKQYIEELKNDDISIETEDFADGYIRWFGLV